MRVSEILLTGKENATPGRILCGILNCKPRELQAAIERERRAGKPICATCGDIPGYFLAANKKEMKAYCSSLFHRAGEIHKTRKACLKTLNKLPDDEAGE